jgi:hypothetical protein
MSASAPLLTSKKRRRALLALIAAPLVALGIAAGAGTAHAATSFRPAEVHLSNGYCSISGWPGGTIFCGTSIGANFPNGTQEIFGIGTNKAVWTDWGTEAHPSGWKSMGGPTTGLCNPSDGLALDPYANYALTIYCQDNNAGTLWYDERGASATSGWGGWREYLG